MLGRAHRHSRLVVQSLLPDTPAIGTRVGAVELERVTVFGGVTVNRLDASESLIQGLVLVLDNQHGCFRFSATDRHPTAACRASSSPTSLRPGFRIISSPRGVSAMRPSRNSAKPLLTRS